MERERVNVRPYKRCQVLPSLDIIYFAAASHVQ